VLVERKAESVFVHKKKAVVSLKGKNNFVGFSVGAKSASSSRFVIISKSNNLNIVRLGIIASRKIGGAVVRNAIRRKIREIFRLSFEESGKLGYDFLLIIRKGFLLVDNEALKSELINKVKQFTSK